MKTRSCLFGAVALAFVAGAVGYVVSHQADAARAAFLDEKSHQAFMHGQAAALRSATDLEVEEALWKQIAALDADALRSVPRYTQKIRATDKALAYARLADLSTKHGASQRGTELLERAAALCPTIGWTECSPSRILATARKMQK